MVVHQEVLLCTWTILLNVPRCVWSVLNQSRPTLCDHIDCSLPGSSVHGDSPGKNTGVGCHALLQAIFPTQGSNPGLPHCHIYMNTFNNRRKKSNSKGKMSGLSGFATFKEKWYTGSWCLSQKLIWSRKNTGFVPFLFFSPTHAFLLFYRTLRQWSVKP